MKRFLLPVFLSALLLSCVGTKRSHSFIENEVTNKLRFLGVCSIPNHFHYQDTWVGGLSGIDYNRQNGKFYAISDDRSTHQPARFYELEFQFEETFNVAITNIHYLKTISGNYFPNVNQNRNYVPDPESIRIIGNEKLLWTTEGERLIVADETKNVFIDPMIYIADRSGNTIDSIQCPEQFRSGKDDFGIRRNAGFEAMDVLKEKNMLVVTSEVPLVQDKIEKSQKEYVRLVFYDLKNKKVRHQFPYQIGYGNYSVKPFSTNGVVEMLFIDRHNLLILERAYSPTWNDNKVKLYCADLRGATDVKRRNALTIKNFTPVSKKLILDFQTLGIPIDNIEGITWGPTLANGNRTLIVVSDNNFSKKQKTQFLLFEWKK